MKGLRRQVKTLKKRLEFVEALGYKSKKLDPALSWSRPELEAFQQRRWREIAARAAREAPFYADLYRGLNLAEVPLNALPPVSKQDLMKDLPATLTTHRVRRNALETWLREGNPDEDFLGMFRILLTSGTTGEPGIFITDPPEWRAHLAAWLRAQELTGRRPAPASGFRIASCTTANPRHISARMFEAFDVGLFRNLAVDPRRPLDEQISILQEFQPRALTGYPSVLSAYLQAQRDGELSIRPEWVLCGGEVASPQLRQDIAELWGAELFDIYATTETGVLAMEGGDHQGAHVFEDMVLLEVVDADERPVPLGEPGHHLLVTCLRRFTQPLIRYRISDQLTLAGPGGPGGLPFRRIVDIRGRIDDSLRFRRGDGRLLRLNPWFVVSELTALPGVGQVRVIQEPDAILVDVLPGEEAGDLRLEDIRGWFRGQATLHHFPLPELRLRQVSRLDDAGEQKDKFRPVISRLKD